MNIPGQEAKLLEDIRSYISDKLRYRDIFANNMQLGLQGSPVYRQSPKGITNVKMAKKCIVFLIKGKFQVGEKDDYEQGMAHVVEEEDTIQLKEGAVVVTIDQA